MRSGRCTRAITPNPAARSSAVVGLVDVDNIALAGTGSLDRERAFDHLDRVAHHLHDADLIFAVASQPLVRSLGLWFRYPRWAFRPAEVGPDAADHQLLEYAHCVIPQRGEPLIVVASGDHIFAGLSEVAALRIVVPAEHKGVSGALRPWLQRLPATRGSQTLAA